MIVTLPEERPHGYGEAVWMPEGLYRLALYNFAAGRQAAAFAYREAAPSPLADSPHDAARLYSFRIILDWDWQNYREHAHLLPRREWTWYELEACRFRLPAGRHAPYVDATTPEGWSFALQLES